MPVDITGVRRFMEITNEIRENLNTNAQILGIMPTFYDSRYNAHQAGLKAMRAADWPIIDVCIGRSVRVGEAAAKGESVLTYEPSNPQADNYKLLGKEIEKWLQKTN